jgi:hypothetical protein
VTDFHDDRNVNGRKGPMKDTISADAISPLTDERRRLLTNQVGSTDTTRNRTAAMLTVASIVAGIFGTNLVSGTTHPKPVLATIAVALALFAISVGIAVKIMLLRDFDVGADVGRMLERVRREEPTTAAGVQNTLARLYLDAYKANESKVDDLNGLYTALCVLVAAQVVTWALAAFWP